MNVAARSVGELQLHGLQIERLTASRPVLCLPPVQVRSDSPQPIQQLAKPR